MNIITIDAKDYTSEKQLITVIKGVWDRGYGFETKNFNPRQHEIMRKIIRKEI